MTVGTKIRFAGERKPYTVRACSDRFWICTKPFNLRHTVLYTIVDLEKDVRGTEGVVFGLGFETDDDCARALERLVSGETEVSRRNFVPLFIEE